MTRIRIALFALFLVACQNEVDPQVAALVGTERVNREVTLTHMVPEPAVAALEGSYEILVANQSHSRYVFPVDFGVRLLVFSEKSGEWREVKNLSTYLPADFSHVLEPRGSWPDDEIPFSVLPVFEHSPDDTKLRIVVVGHGDNGETVAAFIDIALGE